MRRLLAVLGSEVEHSLSPLLHRAAADRLDLDIAYVPIPSISEADFLRAVDALSTLRALGANVTMPHKMAALRCATRRSSTAERLGAANHLQFEAGGLFADNTDGPGLVAVFGLLTPSHLERVQLLGSGGAATAVVFALEKLGVSDLHVSARDPLRAHHLAAISDTIRIHIAPLRPVVGATLVVSSLPKWPSLAEHAVRDWIDASAGPQVVDLAYGGVNENTPLVEMARARGLRADDGKRLLVEQAALSLAAWTGGELSAIRAAMRAVLEGPKDVPGAL